MKHRVLCRNWRRAIIGALLAAMAPSAALAMDWSVVPEQSRVLFEYQRNDQPAGGHFATFSGEGVFDPENPAEATLELRIDSASIDLNDTMASAFATSAEWFDSASHPQVIYRLMKLTPESGNSYHAAGELMIRGRTRPIESTIILDIVTGDGNGVAHASGSLVMDRKDYRLGVGPMALFVKVGREVTVRFELTAHPVR